ncbi:MAG: helix-turn-helix transcriptional regulator [Mycobacteriales bacterium]
MTTSAVIPRIGEPQPAEASSTEHGPTPPAQLRRRELAIFLPSRRERLSPTQVGLPPGGRRRTPGLRREEVAQLANIGITWYTWLEQGRDISVSESVLDAIARTLLLDHHERSHLYVLSGASLPSLELESAAVTSGMRTMLEKLEPFPACIQNARYDLLAFNRTYGQLVTDLTAVAAEDRNSLWLAFTHPAWRDALLDWEDSLAYMVAQYRAAMAEHLDDSTWKCLVKRLRNASPEFVALWERHEVKGASKNPESRIKRFLHADFGVMRFYYTPLWVGPQPGTRFITYTPTDGESLRRVKQLHESLC